MDDWVYGVKLFHSPDRTGTFWVGEIGAIVADADEWQRRYAGHVALASERIGRVVTDGRLYAVHLGGNTPVFDPSRPIFSRSLLTIALIAPEDAEIGEIVIRGAFRTPDDWRTVDTEDGRHFILDYAYWKRVR